MRELTEEELRVVLRKLAEFTGSSLKNILDSSVESERYVFRVSQQRVFHVRLSIAKLATSIARDRLLSIGTCLGRLTKSGRFRLHISALPLIAAHARYRVHIRPNGEMPLLYGGNILKAHVARWSEDCPSHQGVVIYGLGDVPLAFGVSARSTLEAKKLDPTAIVCFRQADSGEYLRDEDTLFAS